MTGSEEIARLPESFRVGDEIIAEGEMSDVRSGKGLYDMPCPGSAPRGMSIFGNDEGFDYVEAFCKGHDVEFFTAVEDRITIKYGGKIELKYRVTEESLKEYEVTLEDYKNLVEELVKLGLAVRVSARVNLQEEK